MHNHCATIFCFALFSPSITSLLLFRFNIPIFPYAELSTTFVPSLILSTFLPPPFLVSHGQPVFWGECLLCSKWPDVFFPMENQLALQDFSIPLLQPSYYTISFPILRFLHPLTFTVYLAFPSPSVSSHNLSRSILLPSPFPPSLNAHNLPLPFPSPPSYPLPSLYLPTPPSPLCTFQKPLTFTFSLLLYLLFSPFFLSTFSPSSAQMLPSQLGSGPRNTLQILNGSPKLHPVSLLGISHPHLCRLR